MRIVCLSDTHSQHAKVEVLDGDVLVHAGDFTGRGERHEILEFHRWLETLPHQHKLVIAGNHDWMLENAPEQARALLNACTYLQDSGVTIDGIKFWGSPWQPWFYDWAFNLQRGPALAAKWALIPTDIDVLVTHGPPFGILAPLPSGHRNDDESRPCATQVQPDGCPQRLRGPQSGLSTRFMQTRCK